MARKAKKKFLTGGKVDYLADPLEMFSQNNLDIAKANLAALNKTKGLDTSAKMLSAVGGSLLKGGLANGADMSISGILPGLNGMAFGGTTKSSEVEVEGDEVAETPNGELIDYAGGPSHEQGGIAQSLPDGTEIFSDRIEIQGKTMAERKLEREAKEAKIEKLLKNNPLDATLKKTLARIKKANEAQNKSDMSLQENIGKLFESTQSSVQKAALGLTVGDAIGTGAQLIAALQAEKDTLANRAGDTIMKNPYAYYGEDAMQGIEAQKEIITQSADQQNQDLAASTSTSLKGNRAGARGINTTRALDLGTQMQANKAKVDINQAKDQQLAALLGQEISTKLGIDQLKIQGEVAARASNEADRDAFDTSMSEAKQTKYTGFQNLAKNLNKIQERNTTSEVMDNLVSDFKINAMSGKMSAKETTEIASMLENLPEDLAQVFANALANGEITSAAFKKFLESSK